MTSSIDRLSVSYVPFDREFLAKSWVWLKDPEVKSLVMAPDFTKEDQERFYRSILNRTDYKIYGIILNEHIQIGAWGLKNITALDAEYWGYIGEKEFWGKGIGKRILEIAETKAIELGLHELWLRVSQDNGRAINLYEKERFLIQKTESNVAIYRKKLVMHRE